MKIIAWNVNGLKAINKKVNLNTFLEKNKPDIFCMSETKLSCPFFKIENELKGKVKGYKYRYWNVSQMKAGYSGTTIWCKKEPISVKYGIKKYDLEGRVITIETKKFYLVHVYTPNSGQTLQRLDYRVKEWDKHFRHYIKKLDKSKPVILCGDLNVAHQEIDIANPSGNRRNAGFTNEERKNFTKLLDKTKLVDTFRYLNPKVTEKYSFWSYRFNSRNKNKGWRIDYFLVSKRLVKKVKQSDILTKQLGSDHAPITLSLS
jgi:exodeoxyribonuclease III